MVARLDHTKVETMADCWGKKVVESMVQTRADCLVARSALSSAQQLVAPLDLRLDAMMVELWADYWAEN